MKIKSILLISFITFCLLLTGCGGKNDSSSQIEQNQEEQSQTEVITDNVTEDTGLQEEKELLEPVIEWFELYNPNGYDTFTCCISNPNDVAVDITYNIVFYKDGIEVSRLEYYDNYSIAPNGKDIIWENYDVPSSEDVDEVRLEDVYISEAYYPVINGSYEYVGVIDGEACFDFSFDSKPNFATIWFVLYNDDNGNDKLDKGEISVTNMANLTDQTGRVSFNVDVHPYTDFDVYFTAY